MSVCHSQALINAPPTRVWELVGDPQRHPEWWPRVIEVRGEQFDEGSNFAQVTRSPTGRIETFMRVERLEELREIRMRCTQTGTYARWLLTRAQGPQERDRLAHRRRGPKQQRLHVLLAFGDAVVHRPKCDA